MNSSQGNFHVLWLHKSGEGHTCPVVISCGTITARRFDGMANPTPVAGVLNSGSIKPSVGIPIRLPCRSINAPPLSPGLSAASVSIALEIVAPPCPSAPPLLLCVRLLLCAWDSLGAGAAVVETGMLFPVRASPTIAADAALVFLVLSLYEVLTSFLASRLLFSLAFSHPSFAVKVTVMSTLFCAIAMFARFGGWIPKSVMYMVLVAVPVMVLPTTFP